MRSAERISTEGRGLHFYICLGLLNVNNKRNSTTTTQKERICQRYNSEQFSLNKKKKYVYCVSF